MAMTLNRRQWIVTFDTALPGTRRATHLTLRQHGHRIMNTVYTLDTDPHTCTP